MAVAGCSDDLCDAKPVSSRKFQAGTRRGEDGSASETRLCLREDEEGGRGAVKEKVGADGGLVVVVVVVVDVDSAMTAGTQIISECARGSLLYLLWDRI